MKKTITRIISMFLLIATLSSTLTFLTIGTSAASTYYPKASSKSGSIVEVLKSVGETDTSYTHRKAIAEANGIKPYSGTASQNTQMVSLCRSGALKKCAKHSVNATTNNTASIETVTTSDKFTYVFGEAADTYYKVTKANAPLRDNYYESGKVLDKLPLNTLVKVTKTVTNLVGNKWLKISYLNKSGKSCVAYLYSGNASKFGTTPNVMRKYAKEVYNKNNLYSNWGINEAEVIEKATGANSKSAVDKLMLDLLKVKLDAHVGKSMNVSSYNSKTYYSYYDSDGIYRQNWGLYQKSGGCTWFAFNRHAQINKGKTLIFRGAGGGNAGTWDNRIHTSYFNKFSTKDLKNGMTNLVAVDDQGSPINGVYYGHVVFVEAVIDNNIYFSEGWYRSGIFHSRLVKKSINDFAKIYETVIISK